MVPELVNVVHADQLALQRPAERHGVDGRFPSGRYCPVLSSVVAPVTAGSASVPLLVKLLFGPVPRSAMATRSVSRTPFAIGVGEVPQVEQAIVEEAVIAAAELHEARDRPGVLDLDRSDPGCRPADGEIRQRADGAARINAGKTVQPIESDARGPSRRSTPIRPGPPSVST